MIEELTNRSNVNWCNEIASNPELWALKEADAFPFFIKEEYLRLKGLFEQKQSYGAYLEIKDLLELLLKIPNLFLISKLLYKHTKLDLKLDNKIFDTLKFLLDKGDLSLGDWWAVAKKLSELALEVEEYPELYILKNISDIYGKAFFEYANIVNWRNKAIGHGALMFDEDDRFRSSIRYLLSAIEKHVCEVSGLYKKIDVYFYDEVNAKKIEKNDVKTYLQDISLWIKNGDGSYRLSPFLEVEDGKIYCFDSYLAKDKFELFDYLDSTRIRKSIRELKELIEKLNLRLTSKDSVKNISNGYLRQEEELYLTKGIRNIVEQPVYLKDKISEIITTDSRGIYLLQMERGMGKTTFVKMLDAHFAKLKNTHITFNGYSVRAYYFNNAYSSNVDIFRYVFEENMHIDNNGEGLRFAGFPFRNNIDFANTINSYQQKYSELKGAYDVNDKLIIILDGVDNIISPAGNECVLDLIPDSTLINNNCFILLTARTDEELSDEVKNKLLKLNFNRRIVIDHNDILNEKFVDQVMDRFLGNSKNEIKQVLSSEMSNYIQTVNLLKPIGSIVQDYVFLSVEDIYEQYFKFLRFIYSDKYFVNIERLLILLANSDISLSIIEIKQLLQIETESFLFLGVLEDIKPFLNEDYDAINKRFTISITNKEFKKYINEHFDAENEKLQLRFLKAIDEIIEKQENVTFVDWFIIYYVIKNTHDILPDLYMECLCVDGILLKISDLILDNLDPDDNKVTNSKFLFFEIANRILSMVSFNPKKNVLMPFEVVLIPIAAEVKIKTEYIVSVLLLKLGFKSTAFYMVKNVIKELKKLKYLQAQDKRIRKISNFVKLIFNEKDLIEKSNLKTNHLVSFSNIKNEQLIDNFIYCAFGLDIPVSHHNIFDGPREFVLGVLDGTIRYLNQVNQESINIDMLERIFLSLISYGFKPRRTELNNNSNILRIVNQRCGYQDIAKWLSRAFSFTKTVQEQWKLKLSETLLQEQFSYSERFYLFRSFFGCLCSMPFLDTINAVNIDIKKVKVSLTQQKNFNFVGYRIKLESMYQILRSKVIFSYDNCLIGEENVLYFGYGRVLGFDIHATKDSTLPSLKDALAPKINSLINPQSGCKQVSYDVRLNELITAHVLNDETCAYLQKLCKDISAWHDYLGESRKKLRIIEKEQVLFKTEEINTTFLKKCLDCINKECLKLYQLISEKKEVNLPHVFTFLINESGLTDQHIRVLNKYWSYYLTIDNNPDIEINIEIEKLRNILFDCKLLKLLTQSLRDNMVKRNIQDILQCSPSKRDFDVNSVTYSELEEYIRNDATRNSSDVEMKIWETVTLKDKEKSIECTPEEFYLLKYKTPELNISNDLFLAFCYHGIIKSDIKIDYKKAFSYFLKSAESGEVLSMNLLGDYYYFGIGGVKKDYSRAFFYYNKASEQKVSSHATYMLGECYYFGRGIKKDLNTALKYFKTAASSLPKALIAVIACYMNNEGVQGENNFAMIHEYLWQASNIGFNVADLNNVVKEMENSPMDTFSKFKIVFGCNESGNIGYRIIRK